MCTVMQRPVLIEFPIPFLLLNYLISVVCRGRLLSDSFGRYSRSPSPSPKDRRGEGAPSDHRGEGPSGYYWTQQLMKVEERDPFR